MDEPRIVQQVAAEGDWEPAESLADASRYGHTSRRDLVSELQRLKRLVTDLTRCRQSRDEVIAQREDLRAQTLQLLETHRRAITSREAPAELYEFAPVMYITLDGFGVIRQINLTGASILGGERAFLEGHPLLPFVVSEHRETFLDHMRRCRAADVENITSQIRLQPRSGEAIPVQLGSRPAQAGGQTLYRTVVSDLTELKKAEEALHGVTEELHQARRLASLGTLASGVAHEINNPLNSISMVAQFALAEHELPPEIREMFRQVIEQTERCGRIVRGMLNFARTGTSEKDTEELHSLVDRVAHILRTDLRLPGLKLEIRLSARRPRVSVNALEMEQVLINLVRNASQASPNGVRVEITTEFEDGRARVYVSDDGLGIPHEHLPSIFDPFYTTRLNRGGTGLGLSICAAVVTEHGGTIRAENQPQGGAMFTIDLPAVID